MYFIDIRDGAVIPCEYIDTYMHDGTMNVRIISSHDGCERHLLAEEVFLY